SRGTQRKKTKSLVSSLCALCIFLRALCGSGLGIRTACHVGSAVLNELQLFRSMKNIAADNVADLESIETREWLDSLDYVLQNNGPARAGQLLQELAAHARRRGIRLPFSANTPFINTIPADQEAPFPGNQELERKIKSLVRWNAISMVVRANKA